MNPESFKERFYNMNGSGGFTEEESVAGISAYLVSETGLDRTDAREMIGLFISDTEELICRAFQHLSGKDFEAMKKTAHTLKGVFLNVGAAKSSALALRLESESAKYDAEAVERTVTLLQIQLEKIKASADDIP